MAIPRRPLRGAFTVVLPIIALGLIAVVSFAVRPSRDDSPDITTATTGDPVLVYAEFGMNEDQIYLAAPDRLTERSLLATVAHAPGWGINPASQVAGSLVAYTVLPDSSTPERDTPAELWLINIETRNKTRLARDADLLVSPVFVDEGAALVYRRSAGSQQELVRVDLDAQTSLAVHAENTSFGVFPVGVDARGALLFARLSTAGTDLYRVRRGEDAEFVFHISDDIARDFQLSPDGEALSYLAPVYTAERVAFRAHVVAIEEASEQPLAMTADASGEQYGPVWTPSGTGVTVGQEALARDAEPAVVLSTDGSSIEPLPAPARGFDVPLGWSADGRFLAVRSFDGKNSTQPGFESTVIIDSLGERYQVDVPTEVIYIGWYSGV